MEERLDVVEKQVDEYSALQRVKKDLAKHTLCTSIRFKRAPKDYYDWELRHRAQFLKCDVAQLTKTMILENLAWKKEDEEQGSFRYYAVVLQYIAKLNADKLSQTIRKRTKDLSKKNFNFQLAPLEVSKTLTGFQHNGVCPFGTLEHIPIVISTAIDQLQAPIIWLGGGTEHVKLGISVEHFKVIAKPIVADISQVRPESFHQMQGQSTD